MINISSFLYILTFLIGFYSNIPLSKIMLTGSDGLEYYTEAHLTKWNSNVHTICMPFSMYGLLLSIPSFFGISSDQAKILAKCLYIFYIGHYLTLDAYVTLLYICMYYPTVKFGLNYFNNNDIINHRKSTFIKGVVISSISLGTQELLGHYYSGDMPSRPEGVLNAILYAIYFSVHNLIN